MSSRASTDTIEKRRSKSRSLGRTLAETTHAFRVCVDDTLRDYGLSAAQFALLERLYEADGPLSGSALAAVIAVRPQTIAEMLGPLARLGLVSRNPHASHGRIIETTLTPDGVALLTTCAKRVKAIESAMTAGLTADEASACNGVLLRMLAALRDVSAREDLEGAARDR